ncbi:Dephospho-CoA kinase domain-containing protein [Geodia barretti]|uniref:Dephospho-CoA kinase domain-containing protein n=1 Tax=Geodia barretti TaxID=519541 RepID=A0AA35SEF1_GEOBA|nr:Dephospho-CoA kinase domain-containing protein [Geodia barretti]
MLIFGLTGGIASGKSTVSRILEELGCPVVDADVLARRVVEPGRPAWRAIVGHFRDEILQEDGTINRERLGSIVFDDESKRKTLNRCTHPYIRREVLWELAKHFSKGSSYVVLVSPLLFETKYALHYMRQTIVVSW